MLTRRTFLKYASILGVVGITGISLHAKEPAFSPTDEVGLTHMDEHFDPDNWL